MSESAKSNLNHLSSRRVFVKTSTVAAAVGLLGPGGAKPAETATEEPPVVALIDKGSARPDDGGPDPREVDTSGHRYRPHAMSALWRQTTRAAPTPPCLRPLPTDAGQVDGLTSPAPAGRPWELRGTTRDKMLFVRLPFSKLCTEGDLSRADSVSYDSL